MTACRKRANILLAMKYNLDKILNKLSIFSNLPLWVLTGLFVLSASVSIIALRQNNQKMVELRNAVYEADRNGGDVNTALNNLRAHVHSHMNTDLSSGNNIKPPVQLKYSYERLQAQEQARVASINQRVYTEAQAHCERLNPGSVSGRVRVPCVEEYVNANGEKPKQIPPSLYQYDFVSPSWSPDLAGWSLVVTGLLFIALAGGFITDRVIKNRLSHL